MDNRFYVKDAEEELKKLTSIFCTNLEDAVKEIQSRKSNCALNLKICNFLDGDIPEHFINNIPISYFCRHIATPSFETLRFIEVAQKLPMTMVISEDSDGKFATVNQHKLAFCKLAVVKGVNRWHDEIVENFSIINISENDGLPFCKIKTLNNESILEYHSKLLRTIYPDGIKIVDEANWINRNGRSNIIVQYKKILSILISKGVMFEFYYPQDIDFIKNIIIPAFNFVEKYYGYRPLIVQMRREGEVEKEMLRYPSVLYHYINSEFINKRYK